MRAAGSSLLLLVLTASCATAGATALAPVREESRSGSGGGGGGGSGSGWAISTQAPWPAEGETHEREAGLVGVCGVEDGALTRVAREIAGMRAQGLGMAEPEVVIAKLRAAGEPDVRPVVISITGRAPIDTSRLGAQVAPASPNGRSRCGIAIAETPDGGEVLVALRVEALADLSPLPTRARTGEWLSFHAQLHAAARSAKLVVLGPRGIPRTVPTSLDANGVARARFALDQPGAFTIQLVGDLEQGPRPLLEAKIFADVVPPPPGDEPPAPGEEAPATADDALTLARMVASLRASEGSPALASDAKLDALARAHAERMRDRRSVAHDLGDGDFKDRFESEGTLAARAVGENVAHAPTVALAHRALHASPSHRINLLRADYTHMGTGVARAPDGSVYVCETFASVPRLSSQR